MSEWKKWTSHQFYIVTPPSVELHELLLTHNDLTGNVSRCQIRRERDTHKPTQQTSTQLPGVTRCGSLTKLCRFRDFEIL